MDIVDGENNNANTCSMKFNIGGAALVFERARYWKHDFENLIVRRRNVVREPAYIVDAYHSARGVPSGPGESCAQEVQSRQHPVCIFGEHIFEAPGKHLS